MPKIDYSKFEEPEKVIVPPSEVTILDKPTTKFPEITSPKQTGIGNAIETVFNPVVSVLNHAIDIFPSISQCIAAVSMEKQRTHQIEAQARAQIETARQETERVNIHETEETKRFALQCKAELKTKKQELEALREKYRFEEKNLWENHFEFSEIINTLNNTIEILKYDKDEIHKRLHLIDDKESYETVFHELNDINSKIVELAKEVAALRKDKT